jgi:hypothetical protein
MFKKGEIHNPTERAANTKDAWHYAGPHLMKQRKRSSAFQRKAQTSAFAIWLRLGFMNALGVELKTTIPTPNAPAIFQAAGLFAQRTQPDRESTEADVGSTRVVRARDHPARESLRLSASRTCERADPSVGSTLHAERRYRRRTRRSSQDHDEPTDAVA